MHDHKIHPAGNHNPSQARPPKLTTSHGHVPAAGHGRAPSAHEGHDVEEFRKRFWICLVLTLPLLAYTEHVQDLLGFTAPSFPGSRYLPLALGSFIFFYGGLIFLRGARGELSSRLPGMMTLISLAIVAAYLYSVATEFVLQGEPLYWELATLIDIMLLGHWIEMKAVGTARGALAELARLLPDTAERIVDGRVEEVGLDDLKQGDLVLVRPGAKVPADGEVVEGESSVNEAMITGESRPVPKRPGTNVIGGTVNEQDGSLRLRVTRTGENTTLSAIMRLVEHAQGSRSRAQDLADRAAFWLVLVAIFAGAITFLAWVFLAASPEFALERMVTVLVIACPHALGLAIPLVISISTTLAARNGLLVRERLALEEARDLDVVVFDKTGTLTRGEQGVVGIEVFDQLLEDEALSWAAAVEGDSEHMIARAIRSEADRRRLSRPAVQNFRALAGKGVVANLDGREIRVGGPRLIETLGRELPKQLEEASGRWGQEGKTVVFLVVDGEPRAAFALADQIRDESREAVSKLKAMGVQVAMLTGDSEAVARWVANDLGISEHFAEVLPEHKADKVMELRRSGRKVAMVGDGVNDAPALLTADVGIAIGAGTDVAIESAGIVLVRNDPRDVVRIIELSRASYRKMVENLIYATGYNVVAIPLAAGVLAPVGILLIPAVGAILMSASTVVVALNTQLLRRLKLGAD